MKRIQMCNKVNSNNNSLNYVNRKLPLLNAVSPDILVGQIWLQDEATGVEIIELNTSDELDPTKNEHLDNRLNHVWGFNNNEDLQQTEDSYKINKKARERRRLNHENNIHTTNTATNTNNHFLNSNLYSDIVGNQYIEDRQLINHQVDCFTMINKNFNNSDSSTDADMEIINSDDLPMDPNNWDASKHSYEEEIITYDPELDKETRTIWIYSFKNKHLLSEDDYELTDTITRDMSFGSTSSSADSYEGKANNKSSSIRRLGSPIPPTYIPRLNLTLGPTLSTVSEVSEHNKETSPNFSQKSPQARFKKQRNSWVMTETEKLDTPKSGSKLAKSTNIVNWMALSPREKRRKQQSDKWVGELLKLETLPGEETNQQQSQDSSRQDNTLRLQVDVDVHVNVNEKTPEKRSLGTPNSANVILKTNTDKECPIDLIKCPSVDIKGDALDRGDHTQFGQTQQVLCLSGPTHIYETMTFNENINMRVVGKLTVVEERGMEIDPELWEHEQNIEEETATYDYLTNKLELAKKDADQAWMKKNAPLLVPSSWEAYEAVAEPQLRIEMSNPNVAINRLPWYKRFLKTLNCFK